jgi:hypothetical protein
MSQGTPGVVGHHQKLELAKTSHPLGRLVGAGPVDTLILDWSPQIVRQ